MSDDSFIREVNEELRREKATALWGRYGPMLIGLAILVVVATGIYQFYQHIQTNKANSISTDYVTALDLSNKRDFDAALTKLDDVQKTGFGAYPALADMRKAAIYAEQGKMTDAVALFDKIADDSNNPEIIKQVARIRAGYLLVDTGTFDQVADRVGMLASDNNPMRMQAWEALGLAAWKAGKKDDAKTYFTNIISKEVPYSGNVGYPNINAIERARLMLELINSGANTPKAE